MVNKKRKLTLQQEKAAQEYVKGMGNMTQAVDVAYPGHVSYGAKAVTGSRLLKNANVNAKIEELKGSILDDTKELGEFVLRKLKKAFEDCEAHRDTDKLGRTLLEVAGFLGVKQVNSPTVVINFTGNGYGSLSNYSGIEDAGLFQLYDLRNYIDNVIEAKEAGMPNLKEDRERICCLNEKSQMEGNVTQTNGIVEAGSQETNKDSMTKQTTDCLSLNNGTDSSIQTT